MTPRTYLVQRREKSISLIILAVLLTWAVLDHLLKALSWGHDSFQLTECLINYAGGFVRRGLPGSIVFLLSQWTGFQANHLVIVAGIVTFALLMAWFLRYSTRIFPAALILSCVVMGIPAYQECIVRKDCLGLLLFLGCLKVDASALPRPLAIVFLNLLACIAILTHEAFAFFALPALILFNHTDRPPLKAVDVFRRGIAMLPAAGCFALTAVFHGSPEIARAVNHSWLPLWRKINPDGLHQDQPAAAIQALGWTPDEGLGPGLNLLTSGLYQPMVWLALFAISFALIVRFTARDIGGGAASERIRVAAILLGQFLFISPLFVLGHDYGRWLFFWAAGSLMLHTLGRHAPDWLESSLSSVATRLSIGRIASHLPAGDWVMLLFGVPVCWNVQSFLIASPLSRHVAIFWSWF
jgi:hypothetical protein